MYIDIHSHLKYSNGKYFTNELLEDICKYKIIKRVVSCVNNRDIIENNRKINEICKKYSEKLIGCAIINPKQEDAIEQIKEAIEMKYIRFVEFDSFEHGYYPDLQKNLFDIFNLIRGSNLIVKIFVGIGARSVPQQWETYLKTFPDINFIFLHMGCFDYGYTCIDVAKRNKNCFVEISNQYEMQILKKALSELGSKKILFGTKYPERLTVSSLHLFDTLNIKKCQKDNIYFKNAKNLLNF